MGKPENVVEVRLCRGVKALGGMAYKWVSPGQAGVPDRIVFLPGGRTFLVELKTDDGRLSPIQRMQHRKLRRIGCDVRTLHGTEDVDEFLKEVVQYGV